MSTLFSIVPSINHEFLNFLDTFVQIITSTSWRKIIERNSIRFVQQKTRVNGYHLGTLLENVYH